MRVGSYELKIVDQSRCNKHDTDGGYVRMRHGEVYGIWLRNNTHRRCNLDVRIDGVSVGRFQLAPWSSATLERPQHDDGRFTFFASGTAEATAAGGNQVGVDQRGLVQVEFTPEQERQALWPYAGDGLLRTCAIFSSAEATPSVMTLSAQGHEVCATKTVSGVTGLGGHSGQTFGEGRPIIEDRDASVTITLRLVHDGREAGGVPRPLPGRRSNPVPPPLDMWGRLP